MNVTDEQLEAIEQRVGMGHGAWDHCNPREIIAAVCAVMSEPPTPTPITAEGLRAAGWIESSEALGFFFQVISAGCGEREITVDPIPQRAAWTFEINGMCICEVHSTEQLASLLAAIRGDAK